MALKIFLLEDETLFRDLITRTLVQSIGAEVVGAYGNAREVVDNMTAIRTASVGLLDVRLGASEAFELIAPLREQAPNTRLIWVTAVLEDVLLQRALDANLPGFVHKQDSAQELILAVERVAGGHTFMSDSVRQCREMLRNRTNLFSKLLSVREQEILKLLGGGFSNEETAAMLGISVQTVKTHRRNIMARLDLHSATELQGYAVRNGFVSPASLK